MSFVFFKFVNVLSVTTHYFTNLITNFCLFFSCNVFYGKVIYDFIEDLRHGCRYFEKLAVYGLSNGNVDTNGDRNKQELELAKYCRNFVSKSYGYGIRKYDAVDFVSVM